MRYYISLADNSVLVSEHDSGPPPNSRVIDGETAAACKGALTDGLHLSDRQVQALLEGDAPKFLEEVDPSVRERQQVLENARRSPELPSIGRWEYRVLPLTEMLGFGTAKGTATRMQDSLNDLASDGWELVTTSERDSRWLGGETVMLTLRRFVVTEHLFKERIRAEERLRRQVLHELDGEDASD